MTLPTIKTSEQVNRISFERMLSFISLPFVMMQFASWDALNVACGAPMVLLSSACAMRFDCERCFLRNVNILNPVSTQLFGAVKRSICLFHEQAGIDFFAWDCHRHP